MIRILFVFDRAIPHAEELNAVYLKGRAGEEIQ